MTPSQSAAAVMPETRVNIPFTAMNMLSTAGALVLPFYYHSISSVAAFLVTYTICGLGLTAGYHRLFAHRSYAVPKWLEHLIAICGYLAIQRGPIFWVSMHRLHHLHVEQRYRDPHTPKEGLWHVHFGWVQNRRHDVWDRSIYRKLAPDLLDDPLYIWMDSEAHDYLACFGLLFTSFAIGGLAGARFEVFDVHNAICWCVWVGLLNRVALLQAFGLINSVCHMFGTRPFQTRGVDESTNNVLVALIIFGEGWHNNHHAFPTSARQGLRWYQLDPAWYTIRTLQFLGFATSVKVASSEAMERKRRQSGPGPLRYAFSGPVATRSVAIAMTVGTVLSLSNQFDLIFSRTWSPRLAMKILFNFLVPFIVASTSAVLNRRR